MSKLNDLTNQTFGLLTVLSRAPDHISPSGRKRVKWLCQCKCGTKIEVLGENLTSNRTISCGCYNQQKRKSRYKDISNQKFGQLTALSPTKKRNTSGEIVWLCQCSCGNTTLVSLGDLRSGSTQSCGCTKNKRIAKKLMKDYTNKTFNYLTALYPVYDNNNNYLHKWHCRCECGKELDIKTSILSSQLSCGCKNISKGEQKIKNILDELNISYETEKIFKDLISKNNKPLRFDFCIYDNITKNILCLIEYQGIQHYEERSYFSKQNLKERQDNDQLKHDYCLQHQLSLIEIPYLDYNLLSKEYLYEQIEKSKKEN